MKNERKLRKNLTWIALSVIFLLCFHLLIYPSSCIEFFFFSLFSYRNKFSKRLFKPVKTCCINLYLYLNSFSGELKRVDKGISWGWKTKEKRQKELKDLNEFLFPLPKSENKKKKRKKEIFSGTKDAGRRGQRRDIFFFFFFHSNTTRENAFDLKLLHVKFTLKKFSNFLESFFYPKRTIKLNSYRVLVM